MVYSAVAVGHCVCHSTWQMNSTEHS